MWKETREGETESTLQKLIFASTPKLQAGRRPCKIRLLVVVVKTTTTYKVASVNAIGVRGMGFRLSSVTVPWAALVAVDEIIRNILLAKFSMKR
jgi:hypothetical protein